MRRALFLLTLASGCAGGDAGTSIGRVVVDTLPDGTPRTMTELPVGWSDTNGWKLVEVLRLTGGVEGPGDLVDPGNVAIDAAGRIYVADNAPASVKQFNADGTYLRTIGRQGQGPGEFTLALIAVSGGDLFVHDPQNQRTSLFDTAGRYVRSWTTSCCAMAPLELDGEGRVGVAGPPPSAAVAGDRNPYFRSIRWYRADSAITDSTLIPSGPVVPLWTVKEGRRQMSLPIPWSPGSKFGLLADHRVIFGFSDRYQLAVTRGDGADTVALLGRTWTPTPIPDAMRRAELDRWVNDIKKYWDENIVRNTLRLEDIPVAAPAFDWIARDGQGDLWVRTPVPSDSTRSLFDVFDPAHRWLGQVSGTKYLGRWQTAMVGDRLVGQGEDDAGNPIVVIYRIDRTIP
jgi:hypothetical protein